MSLPFPDSLCHTCAAPPKYVRTAASLFIRCPILDEKYPRQPVRACAKHVPAIVTTERLALREATPDDEPFVATMVDSLYGMTPAEWLFTLLVRYRRDGHGLWLTLARDTAAPVGFVGVLRQRIDGRHEEELSWHVRADFRGRGYAAEAGRAVMAWALARHDHVVSLIRDDNVASQAVAKKLGMTPGGVVTHAGLPHRLWRHDRR
jgi:RimJ/RimL family protein N-acetyltransferase